MLSSSSCRGLAQFMEDFGAIDSGFVGSKYTGVITKKGWLTLERDWTGRFAMWIGDCTVLELECGNKPRHFRFEVVWVCNDSSFEVVQRAWSQPISGSSTFSFTRKL